ncbi:MAG: glycosyltransferase family 4 protein [Solirubrobacteraceae bacterium]|nr:glycosyltransferase family 4 protein [Solirubrobacteraceae bacterium]
MTRARTIVTVAAHSVANTGGMERQLFKLISGLLDRGHEVTVVARRCDLVPRPGLRIVRVRTPSRPSPLAYPAFFALGSIAVRRHGRGLLHTTGAIVIPRADLSTVHFCHHAYADRFDTLRQRRKGFLYAVNAQIRARMALLGERYCFRRSRTRHLSSVSAGARRELLKFFPTYEGAVTVIPNGVDRTLFRPSAEARVAVRSELRIPPDCLLGVFVGGEWKRKGLPHAIDALPDAIGWHLLVVGGGDAVAARERAAARGVRDRLHFAGAVSDPERYMAAGDAFVLPTSYETFSMATFEAAACGLPLVNTRVSGAEEIVVDGLTGHTIEPNADSVAHALVRLNDAEERRQMGRAALDASAAYGWDPVVDGYVELYAQLRATAT